MIYLHHVVGESMLPTLRPGQGCVFIWTREPKPGEVVLAVIDGRSVVKRLFLTEDGVELRGDNLRASNSYLLSEAQAKDCIKGRLIWPRVSGISR